MSTPSLDPTTATARLLAWLEAADPHSPAWASTYQQLRRQLPAQQPPAPRR